jgi:hypothetical protein
MNALDAATPYLFVLSLFGLAYIYRGTITLMLKILISEFIDREERVESRIYRAQTVERAKVSGKDPVSLIPPGVNGILGIMEEINQMRVDSSLFMSALQLEMDNFKNEVLSNCPCPEEFKLKCQERFDKIESKIKDRVKNGS